MIFNSLDFALFLLIVFILYWSLQNIKLKLQNILLLGSSYLFYAWWDWRFLGLIIASTLVDYFIAIQVKSNSSRSQAKSLLVISIVFNLGLLAVFKYFNFFIESWMQAWATMGVNMQVSTLHIILPVGISFYTFQTLSYSIDVYRKKLEPTTNLVQFAAFVSFFPQLVAGPIERAKHLLPQFQKPRHFDAQLAISGLHLIIWGLFKKVVIADNSAFFVNQIFDNPSNYDSLELIIGAILFGFQIYGDFSGYSDIAIGVARLFGFSLMINFSFPYFSRDIAEFWRRWHISLSTWFRDYLYIPLGGSYGSKGRQIGNVVLVFLISGLWHGANWTFIIWGAIHALLFLPLLLAKRNRRHINTFAFSWSQLPAIITTFLLVSFAWIFFRAENLTAALLYIERIFYFVSPSITIFTSSSKAILFSVMIVMSILCLLLFEVRAVQNNQKEVRLNFQNSIIIILFIVFMGVFKNPTDFIYFQF